ncbi:hypothetical protein DRZ78_00900 [Candidatus Aerophobetes bacterium]|uniref:Uncharacterized protein n=1 Tax=Aerophobetes bacterium TaxID=2030807 RepID=A0A662D5X5_UNCAE|nr:MAG: hypothetical protein DRZ78_00900 [Candidatus Aerophobetes bacterium]
MFKIGGDENGMEEIRDIRDIPAKIQESKKITPIRKRQTQGNKKQFAQEINRYLRKKNKTPLPELKEDGIKNRKQKERTSEEGKGKIIDVKV